VEGRGPLSPLRILRAHAHAHAHAHAVAEARGDNPILTTMGEVVEYLRHVLPWIEQQ
jgi:hypothetical protein